MKQIVVLMGGQGSGKGTIAKMVCNARKFDVIETGAIVRETSPESDWSKMASRGILIPDSEIFKIIKSKIKNSDILFDGFPRTISQAKWLVENYSRSFDIRVLYFHVSEEIMLKRIQKRLDTGGCRLDDKDCNAVRRRLDIFWDTTVPAIDWLRNCVDVRFTEIDATALPECYISKVLAALDVTSTKKRKHRIPHQ